MASNPAFQEMLKIIQKEEKGYRSETQIIKTVKTVFQNT